MTGYQLTNTDKVKADKWFFLQIDDDENEPFCESRTMKLFIHSVWKHFLPVFSTSLWPHSAFYRCSSTLIFIMVPIVCPHFHGYKKIFFLLSKLSQGPTWLLYWWEKKKSRFNNELDLHLIISDQEYINSLGQSAALMGVIKSAINWTMHYKTLKHRWVAIVQLIYSWKSFIRFADFWWWEAHLCRWHLFSISGLMEDDEMRSCPD